MTAVSAKEISAYNKKLRTALRGGARSCLVLKYGSATAASRARGRTVPSESLSLFHTTSICKVGGDFMSAPTAPIVKACNTSRSREHHNRHTHRDTPTSNAPYSDPVVRETPTPTRAMLRSRVGSLSLMSLPHSALIGLLQDLDKAMAASNWGTVCDVLGTLKSTPVTFASIKVAARASVAI